MIQRLAAHSASRQPKSIISARHSGVRVGANPAISRHNFEIPGSSLRDAPE